MNFIYFKFYFYFNKLNYFQSVNASNIHDIGMKYIYDQCPVIAAVGPIENLLDYNLIRAGMYRLRV